MFRPLIYLPVLFVLFFSPFSSEIRGATILSEGFESVLAGWTFGDSDPTETPAYWGRVDSGFGGAGTHGGLYKAYCAGQGNAGTTTAPIYRDNMRAYLRRTIDLSGVSNATLRFWHKIPDIEASYDFARVYMDSVLIWSQNEEVTSWMEVVLDLSPYLGGSHVLNFQFETDPSVTGEGWYLDDISISDGPPLNDNFSSPQALSGFQGGTTNNNNAATAEPGETPGGSSVWFTWTAPANSQYVFSTEGSSFDTLICISTGSSLANLAAIACDDNRGSNNTGVVSFNAVAGTVYRIMVTGVSDASGRMLLRWKPFNDNFSSPLRLQDIQGNSITNNTGATAEPGETPGGASLWFTWSTSFIGQAVFSTEGSAFDTFICVSTGNSLATLAPIACDDNSGTNNAGVVSFEAVAGTLYRIMITGVSNATGRIQLGWNQPNVVRQDLLPDLTVWADESQSYLYNPTYDRTEIPGRVLLRLSTATPNSGLGPLELRGSSSSPEVYQRIRLSDGGYRERLAGTFTYHPDHEHLHFDNFMQYHLRVILSDGGVGPIVASGDKTSFAIIDLQHYNAGLPGFSSNSVYLGGLVQGLSVGWADVYSSSIQGQWIDITGVPAGRYWLEAVVDPEDHLLEMDESNNASRIQIDLFVQPPSTPPSNDNFNAGLVLTGVTAGIAGINDFATREPSEPVHSGGSGNSSVWYRWTAPATMNVVITTDGSSFDTTLAVYGGNSLTSLSLIASNDDDGEGNRSRVEFLAGTGTTYHIAVDSFSSNMTGRIQLNINPALNDNFLGCLQIAGESGVITGSNRGATRESNEPLHAGINGNGSVWYCWTAPVSGLLTFNTLGSSFDTVLAVYTGPTLDALTPVASDNNGGNNLTSRAVFNAVAGTRYFIAVDGVSSEGVVNLNWSLLSGAPAILDQPLSTNVIAGSTITLSVTAEGVMPLSYRWRFQNIDIIDTGSVIGSDSPQLTLNKIIPSQAGSYSVVISNSFGSITSTPANVIVLDNSRVIYFQNSVGGLGGRVRMPLFFQAQGNEHHLQFSILFDPALLGNPSASLTLSNIAGTLMIDTNEVLSGRLGIEVGLNAGEMFPSGTHQLLTLSFDAASGNDTERVTALGFGNQPLPKHLLDTNGQELTALFASASLTLRRIEGVGFGRRDPAGAFEFTLQGLPGRFYVIETSEDMQQWTPVMTNEVTWDTPILFRELSLRPRGFYRAKLIP